MARIDDIQKSFEPEIWEEKLYADWQGSGYFTPRPDPDKKPYTIVIPPPNITGQLHMGHALDNTLQDILIRFKRMQGYAALWLPGTDHASIATEARIVESMRQEGLAKEDLGREGFLERAWIWKEKYGGRIIEQLKRLGASCDWTRERFTMDEGLSNAVQEVFVRLYEKNLIYRGERIINWCPTCLTSISDAEVEYEEQDGRFYHILYPFADGEGGLELATTRPETMLGDTAVAVHPEDERYAHLVGREVILPLTGRQIPVIADTYVERDFGTGVVKITPAHDPNDFEVGLRHDLPILKIMDETATINENGGCYAGLDRREARRRIVADLEAEGLLIKTKPHRHNVGTCYRCHTVVEPYVSFQWFVRMEPLARPAIEAVRTGQTRFVPDRFARTYFNWMENIRDWCISRQLWWGHRIPAWYCGDCGHIAVSRQAPANCPQCAGSNLKQDEDTLDTWFSSALWPFSTLGWPEKTDDLAYFYPTSVLVTAYDIIFFWVARMIFSAIEQTGQPPFHTVFIHGIVRDAEGRKMSKSLDNGIDPLEMVEKYGADALRFALVNGTAPGHDQRFQLEKIESGRNFINKIWNALRFVSMNLDDKCDFSGLTTADYALEDRWILTRLQKLKQEVPANLDKYELGIALGKIYSFLWEEYCDWYIESCKSRLQQQGSRQRQTAQYILTTVLAEAMQLLHPFMPYISEAVWQAMPQTTGSIMVSSWPQTQEELIFDRDETAMINLMQAIRSVRQVRSDMNVPPGRKVSLVLVSADEGTRQVFAASMPFVRMLAGINQFTVQEDKKGIPDTAVTAIFPGGELYLPLSGLVDLQQEIARLEKEKQNLEQEVTRVEGKLANTSFTSRAPEKVVQAERDKLGRYRDMLDVASERLGQLRQADEAEKKGK